MSVVWGIGAARRQGGASRMRLQMWLNARAHEFVEMNHAVLHGRLVGAELISILLVKCTAPFRHTHADFLIFPSRFSVCLLLRLDELALEQHDIFRIIEFDDV